MSLEVGEIPSELASTLLQPVALVGLDIANNGVHRAVHDAFAVNRRADRLPLQFTLAAADHEFPKAKPKRTSSEVFVPRGVLKTNWLAKHLVEIPSLVVLFVDLNWDHPNWPEKKTEVQSKVASLRQSLEGRATRLSVVLVQSATPLPPGEDVLAAERAQQLCTGCDLSPKSLFVLPAHADQHLYGYILRLEHAFHELAQAYYQAEIKRVKSKRDHLSKSAHHSLLARCQFKTAVFNELRQDTHTALRHYKLAYQHLTESEYPEEQWLEWKTVAGYLTYKICRLCFQHNTPIDSIAQFRRHCDLFRPKVAATTNADVHRFEHYAWMAKQHSIFAELFQNAIQNGLAAIQTQHPGFYFESAAEDSIRRKETVLQMWSAMNSVANGTVYPSPDPLAFADRLEFYGQRPWRIALPEGQLTADAATEAAGMQAVRLTEAHRDLTAPVLQWLNIAIGHFKRYRAPRMRRHCLARMAEQYCQLGAHAKALPLLAHVIWEYRQERWLPLLLAGALRQMLGCAYALANVKEFVACSLELLNPQLNAGLTTENRVEMQRNLALLLSGSVPTPPSLHPFAGAADSWRQTLSERCFFLIQMQQIYAGVQATAWFASATFTADQQVILTVALRSLLPLPIQFRKLSVSFDLACYDPLCIRENADELLLQPQEMQLIRFSFPIRPEDAGKLLKITGVSLDVGAVNAAVCGTLQWEGASAPFPIRPEAAISASNVSIFDRQVIQNTTRLEPRPAQLDLSVQCDSAALCGESHPIRVGVVNREVGAIANLKLKLSNGSGAASTPVGDAALETATAAAMGDSPLLFAADGDDDVESNGRVVGESGVGRLMPGMADERMFRCRPNPMVAGRYEVLIQEKFQIYPPSLSTLTLPTYVDNASYHSRRSVIVPKPSSATKQSIKDFIGEHEDEIGLTKDDWDFINSRKRSTTKKALYDRYVAQLVPKYHGMVVDGMAEKYGVTVLRLPPYHCTLNPIEMLWSLVKREVAKLNAEQKIKAVHEVTKKKVFAEIGGDKEFFRKIVRHVEGVERSFCDTDGIDLTTPLVQPVVIPNDSDSGDSDDDDENDVDSDLDEQ